tara:strand:+ start:193 stop:492 length:300 start_codon:yes stop_codon:yes gene_type:complete
MNLKENTLVFTLTEEEIFSELSISPVVKNFIADLRGVSLDVAMKVLDKFTIFEKSISEKNGSFVIVCDFSFDDDLTIVPSLQEAYDYIEMEEIERQLEL